MKKDKMKLAGLLLAIACTSALGAGAVVASGTATATSVTASAETNYAMSSVAALSKSTASVIQAYSTVEAEKPAVNSWDHTFTFVEGSGQGFLYNGVAHTGWKIKQPGQDMYIELGKEAAVGDYVIIDGTFYSSAADASLTFTVKLEWNGSKWVNYVAYTTYEIGRVSIGANTTAKAVYLNRADGEKYPVTEGTWTEKLSFLAGSGVGVTINGTQINMNDIKIPNNMYVGLGTTANEGDILKIGGTFYNEKLAVKYVVSETTFIWNGSAWEVDSYDVYTISKIAAPTDSSATAVQLSLTADKELPAGNWNRVYTFEEGSGTGLTLGETALTTKDIKQPGKFYIGLGTTANEGDILTIDGTYTSKEMARKFVFDNCQIKWNGSAWEAVEDPVPEYNVVNVGTIAPYANTNAARVYFQPADTSVTWCTGSENFLYESGSAFTIIRNGETVVTINSHIASRLTSGAKNAYVMLPDGFALQAGDKAVFGGTYYNEAYLMKYVFTDTEMWWNGTAWQLEEYVAPNPEAYTEVNLGKLTLASQSSTADNAHNQRIYTHTSDGALVAVEGVKDYTTTYVSGTQVLLNGEACAYSRSNVVENGHYYYFKLAVGGQEVGANVGDKVTIGGVFVNEEYKIKYTIEDTDFWWNGSTWQTEEYKAPEIEEPEVEYTIVTLGKAKLTGQSISAPATNRLYLASADDIRFADELKAKNFAFESGTGFVLDGVAISDGNTEYLRVSDNKMFRFYTDKVAIKAGSSIKVGGTFVNEDLKVKIVLEDSEFWWTGGVWQAEPYVAPTEPVVYEMGVLGVHANSDGTKTSHNTTCIYMKSATTLPFKNWDAKFVLVEGDGWKVNGNPVEVGDLVSTSEGLYTNLTNANIQTGDVLSVSGTFYYETGMAKYVVQESKFVWNGTAWEDYVENYATYEVGSLVFSSWTENNQIYVLRADGQKFEVPADGNNGWTAVFLPKAGVGVTLNGTAIAAGKVKFPNSMFIDVGAAPAEGDILTIGGTFYNTSLAMQFVVTETSFMWDGTTWVLQGVDEPEVEYTTHNIGKVAMHNNGGKANHVYLKCADGSALPFQAWENPWVVDGGNGLMVNGSKVSIVEMQSAPDGLYVKFDAIQAGDYITIGGTFRCDTQNLKYVIEESSFLWTGFVWVPYTVAPTTYEIGKVAIDGDSSATAVNFKKASGAAFEATDGTWAEKLYFIAGTGVGVTINGTQIDMSDIKIPNNMYVGLKTTAVAGDELVIGGTFFNGVLAVKYVVEESTFVFDGTNWVEKVEEPEVVYTTHEIGKVAMHNNGGKANHVYLKCADGSALPFQAWENPWVVDGGNGLMVNGSKVSIVEMQSAPDGLYVKFDAIQAGDYITIGGTFRCDTQNLKYVIEESSFLWTGFVWVPYTVAPTTYEIGKVAIDGDSSATAVNFKKASGAAFEATDGTWAEKLYFIAGTGVGVTINGTQIDMSDIKIPNNMYVGLKTTAVAGDELVIGGTFFNGVLAVKYVVEESTFVFDGTNWVEKVEEPTPDTPDTPDPDPDVPEVTYTEVNLGKLTPKSDCDAERLYLKTAGDNLFVDFNPEASDDYMEMTYVSGTKVLLNGSAVGYSRCRAYDNRFYLKIAQAARPGDKVTFGGVYVNEEYKIKYIIEDTELWWNGTAWQAEEYIAPTDAVVYEIGVLAVHRNSDNTNPDNKPKATQLYMKRADGKALPFAPDTWNTKFAFESGDGWKINGNPVTFGSLVSTSAGLFVDVTAANAQPGDVLSVSGTFYCETENAKYVIEESKFVWNGTAWEDYVENYATYEVGSLIFSDWTAGNNYIYLSRADGQRFEVPNDGNGGWDAVFLPKAGVGVTLNGTAVKAGGMKFPNVMFINIYAAPNVGDVLTIGGTFYNTSLAMQYVVTETSFKWDGTTWVLQGSETPDIPDQPDTPVDPSGWTTVELGAVKVHKHSMEGGGGVGANKLYFTSSAAVEYPINSWSSRFTLESGDGWKLNGNAITVKEFISADKHLYITLAQAAEVGDILTVSGTFSYADGKVQYVIEESTFIWNGTYWENYVQYTEYELGTLKFRQWTAGSNHIYLYGADDPRDGSIPKPNDGNAGWTATFKWKDGIGIQINGQNVSASVKYPGEIFIAFSKAPAVGDILTVGGTFYNDDLAIAYIVGETSFTWDGTTWIEVVDYTDYEVDALTTLGAQTLAGSIDVKKADNGTFETNGTFKFLGGSGIGIAINGETIETKQIAILGNMMTFSINPKANEGDVLTIGGTFYNVETATRYIIKESSFIYENGAWSVYESNYNEIGLGEVIVLADASDAQYIYLASKDDTLELPVNSWEAEFIPTFGLGVTLNGQVVEDVVILSVDNSIYLELPSEAQDGDILVIGGKFVCEAEGALYFVKNSQFTWNADEAAWEGVINYNTMEVGKLKLFGNSATETAGKSDRIHFKASSALVIEDFELSFESGIGFTVNGEQREFTLKNVKDGSGYLYFTFDGVEEGDVVTIGGTFYNKEMAVKYVIEESTFIWENGAWSIIYEKVNVGPVIIITTSTSRQDLYLAPANGKTFTASGWESPLECVSGVGITVNGVEINMNNTVKVPDIGTIFVRLTSSADGVAEGAEVVIGGVFRCAISGVEYTIEESTFVYANGAWSNKLDVVKAEAVTALTDYLATFAEGDYYETEWALMTEIVNTAKAAINAEISKFAVESLLANAKADMDAVVTKAAWDAESDQIKAQAKADIESYKNANEYRDADKAVIAATVAQAIADIDAAADWATMNAIVKNAKATMDALWTAAEWEAAEAVVAAAKAELESYKSEADYFVEEWTTIQIIIASASANIDALIGNTASIENVVNDAKARMDAVKTMEQVIADEAVVNAAKDELAGYKAQADYNEPEWNEIQTIIAKAYANIDEAIGDEATIANIVADAKAKMDKVLKSEEANKKAFDDAKATAEAAIRELANSINYDEYSEEAATEISGYLAAAVEAIEAVTEKEDFAKIVEDVTAKIASVEKLAVADDNGSIIDKVKDMAGCGSVVGLTTGVTLMAAAAAIVLNKKKED